jgi:molybdopterin synthase sulfur carrier subunit
MAVKLTFLGALRHACGKNSLSIDCPDPLSVLDLVCSVSQQAPSLRRNLIDEQLDEPKPNALILVNGKEISVLNGLQTTLRDGDEVVFVPVVHGG